MIRTSLQTRTSKGLALALTVGTGLLTSISSALAGPKANPGYSVTTFAAAPNGATGPDSIAVLGQDVFIGYADNSIKTGGGTSTIAEFNANGSLLNTFSVSGHNDGLKVDPSTGFLWAMQNEDGNPNLSIINPSKGILNTYNLTSSNSGGGYDDIVFQNGNVYFSASNAQLNPNTDPAIVQATLVGNSFTFTPILQANAAATGPNGATTTLNLTDADSLTTTPSGNLLLTDQTANQLITVANAGTANQSVSYVPTTSNGSSINVDDTIFPGSAKGRLLVSDTGSNTVYAISGPFSGKAYSAAPDAGFVGALNLGSGEVTPIVTGFTAPKGMGFLPPPVPEPSSLTVFVSAFLGLFSLVWMRKRKATPTN